jgi:hypothetical protein
MKAETFGETWLDIDLPFPCEIHHCALKNLPSNDRYAVLLHSGEPSTLRWGKNDVRKHAHLFNLILTTDVELLTIRNTKFFIFGDSWINNFPLKKYFEISFLYSAGCGLALDGYDIRREVWENRHTINSPKKFWVSGIRTPHAEHEEKEIYPFHTKQELFDSMFSICIENSSEENYFTEKIIDAFRSFTVPIYYGCKNIRDYFDPDGILHFQNINELHHLCKNLNPDDYWGRLSAIASNYEKASKYLKPLKRIRSEILKAAGYRDPI